MSAARWHGCLASVGAALLLADLLLPAPVHLVGQSPGGQLTTWPSLPAFSSNNFLDHFSGASLDGSRWAAVTSGTGTVTVTNSYVDCNSGLNPFSAAFFYHVNLLDKTKSQLWTIAVSNQVAGGPSNYFFVYDKPTTPTPDTYNTWNANVRIAAAINAGVSSNHFETTYYDANHIAHYWDGTGNTWTTNSSAVSVQPTRANDYYILGFEVDGPNARWRMLGWCKTYTSGYTFEQGLRMFEISDWVSWSALEPSSDLWLVFGNPYTDNRKTSEFRFEWIRYAENNAPLDGWCNQKQSLSVYNRSLRHVYSHDGVVFVPQDRTTGALSVDSAHSWENHEVTEPFAVYDGVGTDYLFYTGVSNSDYRGRICVAKAAHKGFPQNGPWTKSTHNPILQPQAGETTYGFSWVLKDLSEPDANRRWKMLYSVKSSTDHFWRLEYATAPDPPDTSPWTRHGVVLDVGAAGQPDSHAARDGVVVWYNGEWEVWYEAWDDNGLCTVHRATGLDLALLTKDGRGPYIQGGGAEQAITANFTGRTVTVGSTDGFVPDAEVVFCQSNNWSDYSVSRIRKILSGTQVELYHGLAGFTTTVPARMKQIDASKHFSPRWIGQVGGEWWFYVCNWEPFLDDAPTYAALLEQMVLYKHASPAPSGAMPTFQYLASPVTWRGYNNDQRTMENLTLLNSPVTR